MNDQRREVYAQRREFMNAEDVSETVADMRDGGHLRRWSAAASPRRHSPSSGRPPSSPRTSSACSASICRSSNGAREEGIDETQIRERIERAADALMAAKAANYGPEIMRQVEKSVLLQMFDQVWKEHLLALDHLRQGIGLRAYGQRDPLNEYKSEAFALFNAMLGELQERVTSVLARFEIRQAEPEPAPVFATRMVESHPEPALATMAARGPASGPAAGEPDMNGADGGAAVATLTRNASVDPADPSTWHNSSRNAPCPCGSGKKYKHCHGRIV